MATIIDELVILLNLRDNGIQSELERTNESLDDLRSSARQTQSAISGLGKIIHETRNAAVLMFSAFTGGKSMLNFLNDGIAASAGMSQLADNIGMSTEAITQWKFAAQDAKADGEGMVRMLADMAKQTACKYEIGE